MGDRDYCAAIVAFNSLLTIVLYPPYALLFVVTLPRTILGKSQRWWGMGDDHRSTTIPWGQ